MQSKLKILFLCTGNSCRSQMAEGWTRKLKGHLIAPSSAGIEKRDLDPRAVQVMAEVGVDISSQHSKTIEELENLEFDYVITVCDNARESCPLFPGNERVIIMSKPPAVPVDSKSLTFTGVYRSLLLLNRSKFKKEGDIRWTSFKT